MPHPGAGVLDHEPVVEDVHVERCAIDAVVGVRDGVVQRFADHKRVVVRDVLAMATAHHRRPWVVAVDEGVHPLQQLQHRTGAELVLVEDVGALLDAPETRAEAHGVRVDRLGHVAEQQKSAVGRDDVSVDLRGDRVHHWVWYLMMMHLDHHHRPAAAAIRGDDDVGDQ